MTFRKDCFEELNEIENGTVYFADESSLKPRGIGSIMLKLHGFPDFLLNNVLYVPKLQSRLMSLVNIRQQGHSIHTFDGIVDIIKSFDNMVIMIEYEDGELLKLKGCSEMVQNIAYMFRLEEGNLPYSLL